MSIKNLIFTLVLALLAWNQSWATVVDRSSPTVVVETVKNQVLKVLKDQSLEHTERRQEILDLITPNFDSRYMSRSVLAHYWKDASPQQQDRFIELFSSLLEGTLVVAIESYTNQKIEIASEKRKGKRALVKVIIKHDTGVVTPINYKMRQNTDGWYAYDVIIEGVSLVSNYRSTFRTILRRDGMDGLLEELAAKTKKE